MTRREQPSTALHDVCTPLNRGKTPLFSRAVLYPLRWVKAQISHSFSFFGRLISRPTSLPLIIYKFSTTFSTIPDSSYRIFGSYWKFLPCPDTTNATGVLIIPTKTKDIIISELEIKETGTNEQEEKEEVYDDQAAQPLAFNTTRIKEEMVVPDYEKSLNDLKIDYEKIRAVFDTQRNIELPWSRESPKWQEFMTAFRSGDTIRSEQLRIEIMAEDKKKKQAESHATVGMDLRDIADEEDDTEEMEDLNNNPPLNAQNILTQEELDAGFHEQMEIYNRLCDQNLLAGSSLSSGNELEPENVAAFNEDRIRRYSLRRAAKKTIKAEKNAGRKGEPKKEKSTAKPKRAKKQSQKNEVPRVESRATRRSQTAEDEPRKLRSRK